MKLPITSDHRSGNNLVDSLRPSERRLLTDRLQSWQGRIGQVMLERGSTVEWAYFPIAHAMASYRIALDDGREVETALVGREGAIGGIVSHGRLPAYAVAVVQFEGRFGRMPLSELETLKAAEPRIAQLFNRYADCLVAQIFQATACNASHSIERRTARWLISATCRTGSDDLTLTQDQLALLLGVGRSYVSRVIGRFKAEEIVATGRGRLRVTDPTALAAIACECDEAVRRHFDEVLEGVYPDP